jgi:small-conductance mechanosensitive channel
MEETTGLLEFVKPRGIPWAILILVTTVIASRLLTRALDQLGDRFADKRLTIKQVGSFFRFALYLVGGLGAAGMIFQLTREVLLALGGTAAVSVGFALKDLVASVVAGLIILTDKPFQVGDRVTFEGQYGEIRHIGLRSVRLITLDDTQITIPNNKFLTEAVASGNAGQVHMMIRADFLIGVDQDVSKAKRVVEEALTSSRYVHLKLPWTVLVKTVTQDGYFAVRLRAKAYVLDVKFEKAFESDVTERVLEGFRDHGIAPPAVLHRGRDPYPAALAAGESE